VQFASATGFHSPKVFIQNHCGFSNGCEAKRVTLQCGVKVKDFDVDLPLDYAKGEYNVGIDKWHCNSKKGEASPAALEAATSPLRFYSAQQLAMTSFVFTICNISGLTARSIGNDRLHGAA
jgi:hypothetical protein